MVMLTAGYKPLVANKPKTKNIFQELTFYKELLYSLQMSYRIHQDEGTLTSLRLVQKLHDLTLSMVRQQQQASKSIVIKNDIEFEYALRHVLG